jgi:hypothetical protein
MKKIVQGLGGLLLALVVLVFAANQFIRVAAGGRDWGIVEEFIFGRPLTEALAPPWSDDFKKWDSAIKASHAVADFIETHGIGDLATSADLTQQRELAAKMSEVAYSNSVAIPQSYLATSNSELPEMYFGHFVPAMDSFRQGFSQQDVDLVRNGVSHYNAFLVWMQSRKRSDFKGIR